jgi:UDP:flavonoid glycosyltransferase YjiC (YdhE family)
MSPSELRTARTHVVVSAGLANAGEATRALELAKALRAHRPGGHEIEITFLSHGGWFEPRIRAAGFAVEPCEPAVRGRSMIEDLQFDPPEFVGSVRLARAFIEGERAAIARLHPDLVLHGLWPFANIAARLEAVRTAAFLAVPPTVLTAEVARELQERTPLHGEATHVFRAREDRQPAAPRQVFRQERLAQAIARCGWTGPVPSTLFEMLDADVVVVNDLPAFYADEKLPQNVHVTGPLFASAQAEPIDPEIAAVLDPADPRPKILCTMGSSGTKDALLEAVRGIVDEPGQAWNAVILVPPSICPVDLVRAAVGSRPGLAVTDRFLAVRELYDLVDVVVSHGGQGTVQSVLAGGVPLVGVAFQTEQRINLDRAAALGAGIRIPAQYWHSGVVGDAIRAILRDPGYREHARAAAALIGAADGGRTAAELLWSRLLDGTRVSAGNRG